MSAPKAPQSTHSPRPAASRPLQGLLEGYLRAASPLPDGHSPGNALARGPAENWLSLDALEPFPSSLWRLPVPNALFDRRDELSEVAFRTALAFCYRACRFVPGTKQAGAGEAGHWTCPERWLKRQALEAATGLSDTATRTALKELESLGWVAVNRSAKAFRYQWTRSVPTERFTQVPTVLLEKLPALPSGTAFDVFWAILRGTWGWTAPTPLHLQTPGSKVQSSKAQPPEAGSSKDASSVGPRMHRRWTQLSVRALAAQVGRSDKSVKQAIKRLNGQWIERVRPSTGAAQFRVLPEALVQLAQPAESGSESADRTAPDSAACPPFSGDIANEIPPDRQRTSPPLKEPPKKRTYKQARGGEPSTEARSRSKAAPADGGSAVSSNSDSTGRPDRSSVSSRPRRPTGIPDEKQAAYDHLTGLGMWPGRARRLCHRYSLARLRRNVVYYQRQAALQPIQTPGAWLYHAVTEDFAFEEAPGGTSREALPELTLKARYTPEEMQALVQAGTPRDHFHRAAGDPETPWMYLGEKGPGQRPTVASGTSGAVGGRVPCR